MGIDNLFGGEGNDLLRGEENDDGLVGEDGNDFLRGGEGNDLLTGGNGDDRLEGADFFFAEDGKGQIDNLTGGKGKDVFVLGNFNGFLPGRALYDDGDASSRGTDDFAVINDFTDGEDRIQLTGRFDYRLEEVDVRGFTGVGIFIDNSGSTADELIGIVSDKITGVDISQLQISKGRTTKSIT